MRRNTMTIKVKNRELIAALKEIPEPDLEFIVDAALSAAFRTVWFRSLMRQRGVDFKPPKGPGSEPDAAIRQKRSLDDIFGNL